VAAIPLAAQDATPAEAEKAQPATTADPSVEPAHLALLLSPLTRVQNRGQANLYDIGIHGSAIFFSRCRAKATTGLKA
jgi:hypothetical protein